MDLNRRKGRHMKVVHHHVNFIRKRNNHKVKRNFQRKLLRLAGANDSNHHEEAKISPCLMSLTEVKHSSVQIQAINDIAAEPCSEMVIADSLLLSHTSPEPPNLLCIERSHDYIRFWWGDVKPDGILSFTLELADEDDCFIPIYIGPCVRCKLDGLDPGTEYKVRICASSETGPGPFSTVYKVSTCEYVSSSTKVFKVVTVKEAREMEEKKQKKRKKAQNTSGKMQKIRARKCSDSLSPKQERIYYNSDSDDSNKDDDEGAYKCHIVNYHEELGAKRNLVTQAEKSPTGKAPTFVEKPKITLPDGGNRIIIECKVRANPKPDIEWFCYKSKVIESMRIKQTVKQKKNVYHIKLKLKNIQFTDAGLYKCYVENVHGECHADVALNIELTPVIKEEPRVITQEIRKKVVIECRVQSVFQPNCIWYKEGLLISESNKCCVKITKVSKGEFAVVLEIKKPTLVDNGAYKMVAKNENGETISSAVQVNVEDEKNMPDKKGTQVMKDLPEFKRPFDCSSASMTIVTTATTSSDKVEFVNEFSKEESSIQLTAKEKEEEKEIEKDEEKEIVIENKEETNIEKKETLKVEKEEKKKIEKTAEKEDIIEKKEETIIEKKEETNIEKKEETNIEKKEETNIEKKEETNIEKKEETNIEKKDETNIENNEILKVEKEGECGVDKKESLIVEQESEEEESLIDKQESEEEESLIDEQESEEAESWLFQKQLQDKLKKKAEFQEMLADETVPGDIVHVSVIPLSYAIYIEWSEPLVDCDILEYNVVFNKTSFRTNGNVQKIILKGLTPDTPYSIQVQAINNIGVGPLTEPLLTKTKRAPPEPPQLRCIKACYDSLTLYWGEGEKRDDIISYRVEMMYSRGFKTVYHGPSTSCQLISLRDDTEFEFCICTFTLEGSSSYSHAYKFRTCASSVQLNPFTEKDTSAPEVIEQIKDKPSSCLNDSKEKYKDNVMEQYCDQSEIVFAFPVEMDLDGIFITEDDYNSLNKRSFVGNSIMNFYLKYVHATKLSKPNRNGSFVFDSSFYIQFVSLLKQLKCYDESKLQDLFDLVVNFDLFKKDIIVIPIFINQQWIFVIICYPGLAPEIFNQSPQSNSKSNSEDEDATSKVLRSSSADMDCSDKKIDENLDSDKSATDAQNARLEKRPCIYIFDYKSGKNLHRIAAYIRIFLERLWKYRNGTERSLDFNKMETFKLECPKITNDFDCGLYSLHFIENFLKNSRAFINLGAGLHSFFPDNLVPKKWKQLKETILYFQRTYGICPGLQETSESSFVVKRPPIQEKTTHRLTSFLVSMTS